MSQQFEPNEGLLRFAADTVSGYDGKIVLVGVVAGIGWYLVGDNKIFAGIVLAIWANNIDQIKELG